MIGPAAAATTHTVCGLVKSDGVFDGIGTSVVAFYATESFHSHNEHQMKYSIGIVVNVWFINILFIQRISASVAISLLIL